MNYEDKTTIIFECNQLERFLFNNYVWKSFIAPKDWEEIQRAIHKIRDITRENWGK